MGKLPQQLNLQQMTNRWATILDPVVANPTNNKSVLKNLSLTTGTNVINHKLGHPLQGWGLTRLRANVTIYDNQDSNQTPELTLILIASGPVIIDLEVF